MNRFMALLMAVCMVFSLCACGNSQNDEDDTQDDTVDTQDDTAETDTDAENPADGTSQDDTAAKVGDILDEPEKLITFADLTELTLKIKGRTIKSLTVDAEDLSSATLEITNDNVSSVAGDIVYSVTDDMKIYWMKHYGEAMVFPEGTTEPYFEDLYVAVKNGEEYAYVSWDEEDANGKTAVGELLLYLSEYGVDSNEQFMKETFAYYGIDYEIVYGSENATFEKCEDETVNGIDCYVYNVISDDDSINYEKIYVDKETGLWVKDEYCWDEEDETYLEIFEIISYAYDDSTLPNYIDTKFN